MERVKILENIYVEAISTKYLKGEEAEVSNELAKVHEKTGHMKILKPDKATKPDKENK